MSEYFLKLLEHKTDVAKTARKYPAVPFVDRVPIADYKFQGTDSVVEKGVTVLIPSYALHRDEKYYPQSEVYDPERFREDITSEGLTNIPFGAGPRSCIGIFFNIPRFYQLELKFIK
ncbi:hypothetical protein C4B38_000259 [Diabrotica virgifera virgifera]|uniref:Cytochrome P450 6k1-like n=1 Tax=Diabrotica virgifera virgifera TaxID=50390 RepID=A0A6P7G8G5_DIAVI|nr:hypothetical protein C4B38_000259 [Diabrotica virgifera virgifera]